MSKHSATACSARGFTLVEVMVALIVICVGLLGIASMQGLAVSSTNGARQRSLAAIEAASLSASMHTNRLFWVANGTTTVTVSGSTITASGGSGGLSAALGATPNCVATTATTPACTPDLVAAFDLTNWATAVSLLLPNPVSTVTCGTTTPLSCTIDIKWVENSVAANKQEAAAGSSASSSATSFENTEYVLFVEP